MIKVRDFENSLIAELCKLTGVKKLRTTPYKPQINGQCGKFNSTLINMIGTLPAELKIQLARSGKCTSLCI